MSLIVKRVGWSDGDDGQPVFTVTLIAETKADIPKFPASVIWQKQPMRLEMDENPSHSQPTDDTLPGEFTEEEIAEVRRYAKENAIEFDNARRCFLMEIDERNPKLVNYAYRRLASIAEHLAEKE